MFWIRKSKPARQGSVNGIVNVPSGYNVRELGGYVTPYGRTHTHRFLRSGGIDSLSRRDAQFLVDYGVRRVLDLRGEMEVRGGDGPLAGDPKVTWKNIPLYDFDMSDPAFMDADGGTLGGYLSSGYFTMLANRDAVRDSFRFFAEAEPGSCILFHCAAGMDRTGVTAMLVLGLCGVARDQVIADYAYSFGTLAEVNAAVFGAKGRTRHKVREELRQRIDAITVVYDKLIDAYGSFERYLLACGLSTKELVAVRDHLVE